MTAPQPRQRPNETGREGQKSVRHGRATVSWGPRFYGPETVIANCPVEAFPDLVAAIELVRQQIEAP